MVGFSRAKSPTTRLDGLYFFLLSRDRSRSNGLFLPLIFCPLEKKKEEGSRVEHAASCRFAIAHSLPALELADLHPTYRRHYARYTPVAVVIYG